MDRDEWLTREFEAYRGHLRAVSYRMLGSLAEADDAVQEAYVRLRRADTDDVENLGGWLTTVVARVCLNMLRSRRTRREDPLDPHVPDPIVSPVGGVAPEQEAVLADSVGLALLVVLEMLPPAERLAFVLHDMFAVPFDEIAPIVDRSPDAARQLASRARRRVQGENTVPDADLNTQRRVAYAFLAAARGGDFEARGLGPFRPFGDEGETMQYYQLDEGILEDVNELRPWVDKSIDVARARRAAKTKRKPVKRVAKKAAAKKKSTRKRRP